MTPRPLRWLDTAPRHRVWLACVAICVGVYAILGAIIWMLV